MRTCKFALRTTWSWLGSCRRSCWPPAGRWRKRPSCGSRLTVRRRNCCIVCSTGEMAPPSPRLPARCPSWPRSTPPTSTMHCRGGCQGSPPGTGARGCSHKCPCCWGRPCLTRAMEHFTGHLHLPFSSPCRAAGGPQPPLHPFLLWEVVVSILGVKGVSQDTHALGWMPPSTWL
ncbi:hypothetical protein Q9966_004561 [Columba livia]|nr:hypothetical protein Q9966_004561 [Columba livia]